MHNAVNLLKIVESTLKIGEFIVYKLYLNKAVKKKTEAKGH